MSGYNRRREGSNAAAASSSVTPPDDDNVRIRGLSPQQYLSAWRNKTGIQDLTMEQIWDHQLRVQACVFALLDDPPLSDEKFGQLIAEAETKSYEIMCNGGTSENWPYPIEK